MRVLTVRQPWASAIVQGWKDIENRTWETRYRGPLLIHAAAAPPDPADLAPVETMLGRPLNREERAEIMRRSGAGSCGGIVGIVDLVDVVTAHPSPWFVGPVGWVLRNPRPLPFRPCRGRLGLWSTKEATAP